MLISVHESGLTRVIELGQPPVDQPQLPLLVVDHHVVRLYISVHDAISVAEVQRFEQLEHVVADVVVGQRGVQGLEVSVIDVLEHQRGSLRLRVTHDIQQLNHILPPAEVLQDLDLSLDLLLLDLRLLFLHHLHFILL